VAQSKGIYLKKHFGQHFLREVRFVNSMLDAVQLTNHTPVFEIGCGDGFLTKEILKKPISKLWAFEIDPDWATYIKNEIKDPRLTVLEENFLDIDFSIFEKDKPWTVLSNLPYQITFPIFHLFQKHRHLIAEGVVMIQEEVAQKLVINRGRGYGFPALFYQRYFELRLLDKVPPTAFFPPPKIFSRLIYFKPRVDVAPIHDEEGFWRFIKVCFKQPRRTLKNNFMQSHYSIEKLSEEVLALRAQQFGMDDFIKMWELLR